MFHLATCCYNYWERVREWSLFNGAFTSKAKLHFSLLKWAWTQEHLCLLALLVEVFIAPNSQITLLCVNRIAEFSWSEQESDVTRCVYSSLWLCTWLPPLQLASYEQLSRSSAYGNTRVKAILGLMACFGCKYAHLIELSPHSAFSSTLQPFDSDLFCIPLDRNSVKSQHSPCAVRSPIADAAHTTALSEPKG